MEKEIDHLRAELAKSRNDFKSNPSPHTERQQTKKIRAFESPKYSMDLETVVELLVLERDGACHLVEELSTEKQLSKEEILWVQTRLEQLEKDASQGKVREIEWQGNASKLPSPPSGRPACCSNTVQRIRSEIPGKMPFNSLLGS